MRKEISFPDVLEFIQSEHCNVRVPRDTAIFDDFVRNDAYMLDEQRSPDGKIVNLKGNTIDSTPGYKALEELLKRSQLNKAEETVLFRELGRKFAMEAEGKVQVYARGMLPWTDLDEVQLPVLLRNPLVTKINERSKEELTQLVSQDPTKDALVAASKIRELLNSSERSVSKASEVLSSAERIKGHKDLMLRTIDKELEFLHQDERNVRKVYAQEVEAGRVPILSRGLAYEIALAIEGRERLERVTQRLAELNAAMDAMSNSERLRHFERQALGWRAGMIHNQFAFIMDNRRERKSIYKLRREKTDLVEEQIEIAKTQKSLEFKNKVARRTEELVARHMEFATTLERIDSTKERLVRLRERLEVSVERTMGIEPPGPGPSNGRSKSQQHLNSKRHRFDL